MFAVGRTKRRLSESSFDLGNPSIGGRKTETNVKGKNNRRISSTCSFFVFFILEYGHKHVTIIRLSRYCPQRRVSDDGTEEELSSFTPGRRNGAIFFFYEIRSSVPKNDVRRILR